ncbi:MAG: helix-turn-helix domain-containing protein, partial [Conexibacter sp.]
MSTQRVEAIATPLPSGRHGLPRAYVLASQRSRLIDAAVRVAGSDCYAAMTVTAVIAGAGVSRRTFYEFFEDREACFLAVLDSVYGRGLTGARAAAA